MPKSRPLLACGERYLVFQSAERNSAAGRLVLWDANHAPAGCRADWSKYATRYPWPLVLERRLLAALIHGEEDERMRRLPLVRLRRHYLAAFIPTTTTITTARVVEPLWVRWPEHTERLQASVAKWITPAPRPNDPGWLRMLATDLIKPLLSSWEHAQAHMARPGFVTRFAPFVQGVAGLTGVWDGLAKLGAATGVDWTPLLDTRDGADEHLVLRTALWRIALSNWVAHRMLPRALLEHGDCEYQATLFMDTHLALLTSAVSYRRIDDTFFLIENEGAVMSAIYPLPHRVCCAEELPDLTIYLLPADLAFDAGRGKKQLTQDQALMHLFHCKMMDTICQIRHLPGAIAEFCDKFPLIAELFRLVILVGLLGNLPEAHHRLALVARVRIQLDFVPDPLTGSDPERDAEFERRLMQWAITRKFIPFFLLREFFIYTCRADGVMDEHFSERHEWRSYKSAVAFTNGNARTEITRQCKLAPLEPICWANINPITKNKAELKLAKRYGFGDGAPACDPIARNKAELALAMRNGFGDGIMRYGHDLALMESQKILKGRIEQLLPKKMIPNEMDILQFHADQRLGQASHPLAALFQHATGRPQSWVPPSTEAAQIPRELRKAMKKNADRLIADPKRCEQVDIIRRFVIETEVLPPIQVEIEELADLFHAVTWAAARDLTTSMRQYCDKSGKCEREPVVPMRYLPLLGFTPAEVAQVRHWVYAYMLLDVADNQLKTQTYEFGCTHLTAFLKLKHYLRLIDLYRNDGHIILLSVSTTLRQLQVLRSRLCVEASEATPPALGKALLCGGCEKWATWVKPAPIWVECRYDERRMNLRIDKMRDQATRNGTVGAQFRARDFLIEPYVLNGSDAWLNLEDGERYCQYGKYPKDSLTTQREVARIARGGRPVQLDDSDDDEAYDTDDANDDDDEADEDDDDAEEEEVEPNEPTRATASYTADMLYLEHLDPGMAMSSKQTGAGLSRLGRSLMTGGVSTASTASSSSNGAQPIDPNEAATLKKRKSAVRYVTSRMLDVTMNQVLKPWPRMGCRPDYLLTVDMVGIWFSVHNNLYGLCVYCGDLTTVRNEKIMTHGLSCMNHPHYAGFRIDHPHMQATLPLDPLQQQQTAALIATASRQYAHTALKTASRRAIESYYGHFRTNATTPSVCTGSAAKMCLLSYLSHAYGTPRD